jgi:hypothetical protein
MQFLYLAPSFNHGGGKYMSLIRDAISKCNSSNETEKKIKEQLETLAQLAEEQYKIGTKEIEEGLREGKATGNLTVPIRRPIALINEIHVVTNEGPTDIVNKIYESLKIFLNPSSEKILTGIANILGTSLNVLMGMGEGMEANKRQYMVAVENQTIIRLDFAMWVRNTRESALKPYCKNLITVTAYKSTVDIKKLDFETFSAIYTPVLKIAFGSNQSEVERMIAEAKNVYNIQNGMSHDMYTENMKAGAVRPLTENQLSCFEQVTQSSIKEF